MERSNDRRIRKTRAQLRAGLTKLMQTKNIREITVRELVDEVDINRSTFYLHYTDIYDMLNKIEAEFFDSFLELVKKHEANSSHESVTHELENATFLMSLFQILQDNADLCLALMGPNGDLTFVNKVIATMMEHFETHGNVLLSIQSDPRLSYAADYCLYGCIGIINKWLENGTKESPKEMADITSRLLIGNINFMEQDVV